MPSSKTLLEALSDKFTIGDGCWEWTGARWHGYGNIGRNGKTLQAHRVLYELLIGPIPEGLTLDHLCRNRACVRPAHLEPVSLAVNVLRGEGYMARHARKTHCPEGHAYEGENLRIRASDGARICRACARRWKTESRARRKARGY